jgi:hypothetical protein
MRVWAKETASQAQFRILSVSLVPALLKQFLPYYSKANECLKNAVFGDMMPCGS